MNQDVFNLLCPYQIRWLNEPAGVAIAEKSRRIGWTWVHALGVDLDLAERDRTNKRNYYHSSADETASREFIDYCAEWARMLNAVAEIKDEVEIVDEKEIRTKVLEFANGCKIVAGSSNPTFLRSKGGAVGLDEFAFHRDGRELVKAAHATARFWGYPLRIWSTHNGDGSFFNGMIKDARAGKMRAAVHRVTIMDAVEEGIFERIQMRKKKLDHVPAPDAGARKAWLEELRAECPDEATWQEEYMCNPQTEANSLLTYEMIRACERTPEELKVVSDPRDLEEGLISTLYVGGDIGRQRDLTEIWGGRRVSDLVEVKLHKTFAKTDYTTQEGYFDLLLRSGIRRLCIDATGIGNMLAERLVQKYGRHRVEAVTFTAESKAGMAMPLVQLFEDHRARIPQDPAIREGLHKVRKIVTSAGNVRFDAAHDEAGHADEFWGMALMYAAMEPNKVRRASAPLSNKPVGW